MFLTRETDYAIRCVQHIAARKGGVTAVAEIALESNITKTFAAKILQKLVSAGIVKSVRGVKGGFSLARPPSKVSVLDVIEAVQGEPGLNICVLEGGDKNCERTPHCSVHPVWKELQSDMIKKLSHYSFSRLQGMAETGQEKTFGNKDAQ